MWITLEDVKHVKSCKSYLETSMGTSGITKDTNCSNGASNISTQTTGQSTNSGSAKQTSDSTKEV